MKKTVAQATVTGLLGGVLVIGATVPAFAKSGAQFIEPNAGEKQVNILSYNDFHGRLSNLEGFTSAVLTGSEKYGAANTLVVGNGDQVGASEFESSLQKDEPTMAALVKLADKNNSFTTGNHEFDQGAQDAAVRIRKAVGGTLLGANVTKEDGSLFLDAYKIFTVNGVKVAVVGAVTDTTPAGVSPDGIKGIKFGDPVEAVNKYANQLKASHAADVVIASYHEGGPDDDLSVDRQNAVFNHMVNDTAKSVDVIFNAHTHREYTDTINGRPVLQALSYGTALGQVVLTMNADNTVKSAKSVVVDTYKKEKGADGKDKSVPVFPAAALNAADKARYDEIVAIKTAAYKKADELGKNKVGVINEDITRAYKWEGDKPTTADDRAEASSLGVLVAESMLQWANANTTGADLSIMNPGGLRADLAGDGELTFKDTQTVLPFNNTLALVELTGKDIKDAFEQQWQRDKEGKVPPRAYLQLGTSKNVSYTSDASRKEGDRITSITINDKPIELEKKYKLVTASFLAAGGDNFHALANGKRLDTGSLDVNAFNTYVKSLPNAEVVKPVARPGIDTDFYTAFQGAREIGKDSFVFHVNDFELRSKGRVKIDAVKVLAGGKEVGTAKIGTAKVGGADVVSAEITVKNAAGLDKATWLTVDFQGAGKSVETLKLPVKFAVIAEEQKPLPDNNAKPQDKDNKSQDKDGKSQDKDTKSQDKGAKSQDNGSKTPASDTGSAKLNASDKSAGQSANQLANTGAVENPVALLVAVAMILSAGVNAVVARRKA